MARVSFGLDLKCVPDLAGAVEDARNEGFDFVCAPICHPRNRRRLLVVPQTAATTATLPWTRSDTVLDSGRWTTLVVGTLSPWLALDAPSAKVRANAARAFWQEMLWATHLSLPAVVLRAPQRSFAHFAHFANEVALRVAHLQLWLRVPARNWPLWNAVRVLCDHSDRLGAVLELSDGETGETDEAEEEKGFGRWLGEPVRAVVVPTAAFLTNRAGYPVLSRRHQRFFAALHGVCEPQIVLSGAARHGADAGMRPYMQYLQWLRAQQRPAPSAQDDFEAPYYDYLQVPLQPLADNLESQTYETFEKDPVKYKRYEEAMEAALVDMRAAGRPEPIVLMVVGAGRGPLVQGAIAVSEHSGVRTRIYAVEKNPNALVTLRNKKLSLNWETVTIVEADMREWAAPEQADILVSELLGSFGDNELSPECLDGAQRFLKRDGGISIPYKYTSYIAPVSTAKLHNEIRTFGDRTHWETPYIVKLHNFHTVGGMDPQPCFTFEHPNWSAVIDNSRYTRVDFTSAEESIVHGIAGYFQAMLYKDIHISINPPTFSDGMFSWFPMLFPLQTPVVIPAGSTFTVHMWRELNKHKCWYEWCITGPCPTPIHNPNGRSYHISLMPS